MMQWQEFMNSCVQSQCNGPGDNISGSLRREQLGLKYVRMRINFKLANYCISFCSNIVCSHNMNEII